MPNQYNVLKNSCLGRNLNNTGWEWCFDCFLQVNVEGLVLVAGSGVGECLQDTSAPVRLAAERCALHLFQLTRGEVCYAFHAIVLIVVIFILHWSSSIVLHFVRLVTP